jgi:hypothetical protein
MSKLTNNAEDASTKRAVTDAESKALELKRVSLQRFDVRNLLLANKNRKKTALKKILKRRGMILLR